MNLIQKLAGCLMLVGLLLAPALAAHAHGGDHEHADQGFPAQGLDHLLGFSQETRNGILYTYTPMVVAPKQGCAEKIKVLMIDGQNNHNWRETSPVLIETFNAIDLFELEVATVLKGETKNFKPDWTKYDVVVMNYVGESWPQETKAGFEKYMKEGGGMVSIHAANNAFPKWKEYNRMTGLGGWGGRNEKDGPYVYWKDGKFVRDNSPGRGGAHGSHWEYKIDIRLKDHPITNGLPSAFLMAKEELYDRLRGPAENMTILATAFADPKTKGSGRHEPVLMTIDYGKGRVFHTTLGHSGKSMKGVAFQETLFRGTQWAATGEVTFPAVSAKVLPADRAASREPKEIEHEQSVEAKRQ